jgi:hypothetical protein
MREGGKGGQGDMGTQRRGDITNAQCPMPYAHFHEIFAA